MLKSKELISNGLVEKLTDEVYIIRIKKTKYILKKIILPIEYINEKNKYMYLKYLISNDIKVAKIIDFWFEDNICYELQEYIFSSNNMTFSREDIIAALAKFHKVSSNYRGEKYNCGVYNVEFECYGTVFNQLLLGFYEKYYLYSKKSYNSFEVNDYRIKILFNKYEEIFFKLYYSINLPWFICHNDMTFNNILRTNKEIVFIDFDLGIKTIPHVDVVDVILSRDYNLNTIVDNIEEFKLKVYKIVSKYNAIFDILEFEDVINMIKIKVISFFFYIHYNNKNFNIFESNLEAMLKLVMIE